MSRRRAALAPLLALLVGGGLLTAAEGSSSRGRPASSGGARTPGAGQGVRPSSGGERLRAPGGGAGRHVDDEPRVVAPPSPPTATSTVLEFAGTVEVDRRDQIELVPAGADLVVRWMCEPGARLRAGDVVVAFGTSLAEEEARRRDLDLAAARAQQKRSLLDEDRRLEDLVDQRDLKRLILDAARARLERLKAGDVEKTAALASDLAAARERRRRGDLALERRRDLHRLGLASALDVEAAAADADRLAGEEALADLRHRRAASGEQDAAEIARQELRVAELASELAEGGSLDRRLSAQRAQREGEARKSQAAVARAERAAQEATASAADHLPLAWLTVAAADGTPQVQVCFRPGGLAPPAGWTVDDGAPAVAGKGWSRDLRAATARAGKGRDAAGDPRAGLLLVRGTAQYHHPLADGTWTVRLGYGDDRPWQGLLARVNGTVLVAANEQRVRAVAEAVVTVAGGEGLRLEVGDAWGKALRATCDGVARPQPWINVGNRSGRRSYPFAYLADQRKAQVRAVIHQDLAAWLRPPGPAEGDDLRARLAATTGFVTTPEGRALPATVVGVDPTPLALEVGDVWNPYTSADPLDLVGRAVVLAPAPEQAALLPQGARVTCRVALAADPAVRPLPLHRTVRGDGRAAVLAGGVLAPVTGWRAGASFLLVDGPAPDAEAPLGLRLGDERAGALHAGTVVPGTAHEVFIPKSWGRIASMAGNGTRVGEGHLIVHLYNPSLDAERDRREEDKVRARQDFLVAVENRRVKTAQARAEHDAQAAAERSARLRLAELAMRDPVAGAATADRLARAEAEAARAADRCRRLGRLEQVSAGERAQAEALARQAALRAQRALLDRVAWERTTALADLLDATGAWDDAVATFERREQALVILRREEQAARVQAQARLTQAMQGSHREREFDEVKDIASPARGRIFFRTGWDDAARRRTTIGRDFIVWSGLVIADILDMAELGMEIELPEERYGQVRVGQAAEVGFPQWPGLRLPASVHRVGREFRPPRSAGDAQDLARVVTVTVRFRPPADLQDRLAPGAEGWVYLP